MSKKISEFFWVLFGSTAVVTSIFGIDYGFQLYRDQLSASGAKTGLYAIFAGMALTLVSLAIANALGRSENR